MLLHPTYGAGASSVCLEANWLRALSHSNDVAGDRQQDLKPSWEDLRMGVLDDSWPVSSNLSHFIHQNIFICYFFI